MSASRNYTAQSHRSRPNNPRDPYHWQTVPVPDAQRDPGCPTCTTPNVNHDQFDANAPSYPVGDIVALEESVHAPCDILFGGLSVTSNRAGPSRGKHRPAVILPGYSRLIAHDPTVIPKVNVCVLASYEGMHSPDFLPEMVKQFTIPVSPHCAIAAGVPHIHTCPEWKKPHVWLIASQFVSTGNIKGRWQWSGAPDNNRQKHLSFKLDKGALADLIDVCTQRLDEWTERCENDEEYLKQCQEEYRLFRDTPAWSKHLEEKKKQQTQKDEERTAGPPQVPMPPIPETGASGSKTTTSPSVGAKTEPADNGNNTSSERDEREMFQDLFRRMSALLDDKMQTDAPDDDGKRMVDSPHVELSTHDPSTNSPTPVEAPASQQPDLGTAVHPAPEAPPTQRVPSRRKRPQRSSKVSKAASDRPARRGRPS